MDEAPPLLLIGAMAATAMLMFGSVGTMMTVRRNRRGIVQKAFPQAKRAIEDATVALSEAESNDLEFAEDAPDMYNWRSGLDHDELDRGMDSPGRDDLSAVEIEDIISDLEDVCKSRW